ncbi:MAG TPA: right-handed parallel beta-helix repeat-containing protein [bacterium]|nr:right-handed parallel beta-helix repeat-containing protein [bacterium]
MSPGKVVGENKLYKDFMVTNRERKMVDMNSENVRRNSLFLLKTTSVIIICSLFFIQSAVFSAEKTFIQSDITELVSNARSGIYLNVTDYFPDGYVRDGSVNYQNEIQKAVDDAAELNRILKFPPMKYLLNESGIHLRSGLTMEMPGAVFLLDENRSKDGHVFWGLDVSDLIITGGEIAGMRDKWAEGVNIRGFYLTGRIKNIRISEMYIHDLSSNGIGIFGDPTDFANDIWIKDVVIDNCSNYYGDYLSEKPGPEKGSKRTDQGLIAMYHVRNFVVDGSRFDRSRSDATHFYKCENGQFVNNKVYGAQMGGYFLETSVGVLASNNLIIDNGSRGVTIERGSRNCSLVGNFVSGSGREGLWAPDSVGLVVTSNIFDKNGRKPNGSEPNQVWNANITIDEASHDKTDTLTEDYMISDNIIYTTESQIAAIRVDADKSSSIIIKNNLLKGDNHDILVQGDGEGKVYISGNENLR